MMSPNSAVSPARMRGTSASSATGAWLLRIVSSVWSEAVPDGSMESPPPNRVPRAVTVTADLACHVHGASDSLEHKRNSLLPLAVAFGILFVASGCDQKPAARVHRVEIKGMAYTPAE
jgi:hypothetical protein